VAYQVKETRGFVRRQLLAIGLTLCTGLGIILAIALFLVGDQIGNLIAGPIGLGDTWALLWNIARFPLILVILVAALAALYWAGPNTDIPFRWLSPGAILGVVGWVIITLFVNIYFRFAGGYATSYGPLGGVLAFIFYLYLMSLVILIGGELNALLARRVTQAQDSPAADRAAAEHAEQAFTARVDDRVRDAIRDARRTLGTPCPASTVAASADVAPERTERDRGTAVRRLAVGAGVAAAGVASALLGRR
jgi:membrane protein